MLTVITRLRRKRSIYASETHPLTDPQADPKEVTMLRHGCSMLPFLELPLPKMSMSILLALA